jgi:hypothetical protein
VDQTPQTSVPESFLEHRQIFDEPWIDKWIVPNPFILAMVGPLRAEGVELADFSFNKDASNVGENYLNVAIRKLNAAVRIAVDNVTFIAANPDWEMAPQLARIFDHVTDLVRLVVGREATSQSTTLALHVNPGAVDFKLKSAMLIDPKLSMNAEFCGISVHRRDSTLIIDKSLKYPGAAFVRLQRLFGGNVDFSGIAKQMYEDEVAALRLLGLTAIV